MRITGGTFRGRLLDVPKGDAVRPTQDRVREALFSMLLHDVPGARFLDLFAGSGSVGLEALSRGAAACTFVERERRHADCLRANAARLRLAAPAVTLVETDAYAYLDTACAAPFDIVYADPPYALGAENGYGRVLAKLAANGFVRPGGIFIAEMTAHQRADAAPGWTLCRDRTYGKTRLCVWCREAAPAEGACPRTEGDGAHA